MKLISEKNIIRTTNISSSYNILYLGEKDPFYETLISKGLDIDIEKNLNDFSKYDIIIVGNKYQNKLDVETSKQAIAQGKCFFILDVKNDAFIQNNFFNSDSSTNVKPTNETSFVKLYFRNNAIQSTRVVHKIDYDNYRIYEDIIRVYEDKIGNKY